MEPYHVNLFYNPSATYSGARTVKKVLEDARIKVAACLGARPSEIIFTAGGTEANNLAIHGVMRQYPNSQIIVSAIEHSAVLKPASHYASLVTPVTKGGIVDVEALSELVTDETVLISCMYANNEIGTIQPIRDIAASVQAIRKDRLKRGVMLPLYLHVDACQAPNYLDVHSARLGADLISFNGSKIYGPKQSGALFVKGGLVLETVLDGGGQERGLRSGTENIAGIVGFATALDIACAERHGETKRLQEIQKYCFEQIALRLPLATINGSLKQRLPNNIHLTLAGYDNERVLIELDEAGIMAAAGSACSASSQTPSSVLAAIGLSDEMAQSSIRATMGRGTVKADIDRLINKLVDICKA